MRIEEAAEARHAFRQRDAVQPVLQATVLAAEVDLAKAVHRRAGCLEQQRVDRGVGPLRQAFDRAPVQCGGAGPQRGRYVVARGIEPLGAD